MTSSLRQVFPSTRSRLPCAFQSRGSRQASPCVSHSVRTCLRDTGREAEPNTPQCPAPQLSFCGRRSPSPLSHGLQPLPGPCGVGAVRMEKRLSRRAAWLRRCRRVCSGSSSVIASLLPSPHFLRFLIFQNENTKQLQKNGDLVFLSF